MGRSGRQRRVPLRQLVSGNHRDHTGKQNAEKIGTRDDRLSLTAALCHVLQSVATAEPGRQRGAALVPACCTRHAGSPCCSAAGLRRDRLSGGLGPLRRLPFAPWRGFPRGATFYASDDLLAVSCFNPTPESDEYLSVWVGARDQFALSAVDPFMDESWEYDSRRER
jgi:hypothetical protein